MKEILPLKTPYIIASTPTTLMTAFYKTKKTKNDIYIKKDTPAAHQPGCEIVCLRDPAFRTRG